MKKRPGLGYIKKPIILTSQTSGTLVSSQASQGELL